MGCGVGDNGSGGGGGGGAGWRGGVGCLLQQLAVAGDVAALGQLGERDVGGDDADE